MVQNLVPGTTTDLKPKMLLLKGTGETQPLELEATGSLSEHEEHKKECKQFMMSYWLNLSTSQYFKEGLGYFPFFIDTSLLFYLPELLKESRKINKFAPVESITKESIESIKEEYDINFEEKIEVVNDPEDFREVMRVELSVDIDSKEEVFEIWKEVSNKIRNEIDQRFGEESKYQSLISIVVQPMNKE